MGKCLHCDNIILPRNNTTKARYEVKRKKFCSHSCAASYNNKFSTKHKLCLNCNKPIAINKKYCTNKCQQEYLYNSKIKNYLNGITKSLGITTKKYLIDRDGNKCNICNITNWNTKPIVFEIEHIDGNSDNNLPLNLMLLCPNCHSQTDTFKGKNKGNGRYKRRQRYIEKKSY